jgi:FkbH-like protein
MSESIIKNFFELKKNLKKDFGGMRPVSVAIVGDSSTQFLTQCLKAYGYEAEINFTIHEADYDQVESQVLNTSSELYQQEPDFVIIFQSSHKLLKKFKKSDKETRLNFAAAHCALVQNLYQSITSKLKSKVIYFNFAEIQDSVFGNYSNKTELSFIYQLRKINFELMNLSRKCKDLYICDYSLINVTWGRNYTFDPKLYYTAEMVLSLDVLPWVAKNVCDIVLSVTGRFKKCLILDLDNTIWGGVIGDDGMENIQLGDLGIGKAFTELQLWAKQLKERGIILAVCSKNNEETAKEPFEKHPDMALALDDIALFVANWDNKVDNIRYIQNVLNIGFDSMVFLDDNPFERNMVRTHLPEVMIPELPEDPALYLEYLRKLNLFETASFSEEDTQRTKQYQEEAQRVVAQKNYTNEDEFLQSLNMVAEILPFNKFNTPRVAQLSQRSNQFNLRTVRYTEQEIVKIANSSEHIHLTFSLRDKFGDNGLIAAVILQKRSDALFIDTWFMSCRVLKRGMEQFTLNMLVAEARKAGFKKIIGQYIQTSRNSMVKGHYPGLGFSPLEGDHWELDVDSYVDKKCFILPNYN